MIGLKCIFGMIVGGIVAFAVYNVVVGFLDYPFNDEILVTIGLSVALVGAVIGFCVPIFLEKAEKAAALREQEAAMRAGSSLSERKHLLHKVKREKEKEALKELDKLTDMIGKKRK